MLYILPGVALLGIRPPRLNLRQLAIGAALAVAPLSLKVMYPALRAAHAPQLVYPAFNTASLATYDLTMRAYAHRLHAPTDPARWWETVRMLAEQLTLGGTLVGLIGMAILAWALPLEGCSLVLIAVSGLVLVSTVELVGREYHLIPVLIVLTTGIGWCVALALRPRAHFVTRGFLLAAIVPVWLLAHNTPYAIQGRSTIEYDYGRSLLDGLPPQAALFITNDDQFFSTLYLQIVDHHRRDVIVIPRGYLAFPRLKPKLAATAPDLLPILNGPFTRWQDDEAAVAAVRLLTTQGHACFITDRSRQSLVSAYPNEPRDGALRLVPTRPEHRLNGDWMTLRHLRLPANRLTWKQGLMIRILGERQAEYATFLAMSGQPLAALTRFRRALSCTSDVGSATVLSNYAQTLLLCGQRDNARALFQRLAELAPIGSPIALNATEQIRRLSAR